MPEQHGEEGQENDKPLEEDLTPEDAEFFRKYQQALNSVRPSEGFHERLQERLKQAEKGPGEVQDEGASDRHWARDEELCREHNKKEREK